jgi:GNAT superfamily N-acetyltransferase
MRRELATGNAGARGSRSPTAPSSATCGSIPCTRFPTRSGSLESHAYLSNLYVKPTERGGTGTELLDTAIKWSRSNGIDRVVLWPSPRSVTLYLRHGFSHGGEVMELNVSRRR